MRGEGNRASATAKSVFVIVEEVDGVLFEVSPSPSILFTNFPTEPADPSDVSPMFAMGAAPRDNGIGLAYQH